MKKKLIQILMLVVATVSVGSFVSCKDTNEDLYNELRTQTAAVTAENESLQATFDEWVKKLQEQIDNYSKLLADLKALEATTDQNTTDIATNTSAITLLEATIKGQITEINKLIGDLTKEVEKLKGTPDEINKLTKEIDDLKTQLAAYTAILDMLKALPADVTALQTLTATLRTEVDALNAWKETVKSCNCEKYTEVLTTLAALQADMATAKTNIDAALTKAQEALTNANTAKTLAETASAAAEKAYDYAKEVEATANQATQDAALAKQKAQDAWDLATQALLAANQANALATEVTTLKAAVATNTADIENNKKDIQALKTTTENITKLINDNKTEVLEKIKELVDRLSADETEYSTKIAENASKIVENASKIADNASKIADNAKAIADAKQDISDINAKIAAMEATIGLMSGDIQKAFDKANAAAAQANANYAEISALKAEISALKTQIEGIQNSATSTNEANAAEIKSLKETTQNLQTAINELNTALTSQISGNTTEIARLSQALDDLKEAGNNTKETVDKLSEKVSALETNLATLELQFDALKTYCETNLQTIKTEFQAAIEQVKLELQQEIENKLKDYLRKEDFDLSNYVTKEEVANYIARAELDNYAKKEDLANLVSQDVIDLITARLDAMMPKTEIEAAIKVAIGNLENEMLQKFLDLENGTIAGLRDRIAANEEAIDWLKAWHDALEAKGGCITQEQFDAWLQQIMDKLATIEGGTSTTIIERVETIKEEIKETIIQDINSTLTTTIEDVISDGLGVAGSDLSDIFTTFLDTNNYVTEDQIEGLAQALLDIAELKSKYDELKEQVDNLPDYEERVKALEEATKDLAQLTADVTLLKSTSATKNDLLNYVKVEDLKNLLKNYITEEGDNYSLVDLATQEELDAVIAMLDDYAKKTDLAGYATKEDIAKFVTVGDLAAYAKTEDLDAYAKLEALDDYLKISDFNIAKQELLDKIETNSTAINEIKTTLETVTTDIETIKTDIQDLQTRVGDAESKLTELETKYDAEIAGLKSDIKAIQNMLAKQVTGIIVQGTTNPMFGTFSLPTDVQSNVLIAFYGLPASAVEFPTYETGNYGGNRGDQAFSADEISKLKEQGLEVFEAPANKPLLNVGGAAGKVYMTINPNTADLDGLQLKLVNTKDEESPIKLRPIQKSEEKLQFGYTRANNGFYEAEAYVTPYTVQNEWNGIALTRDDIQAVFGDVKNAIEALGGSEKSGHLQIGQTVSDIYNLINKMKMDQAGLKCTYTTDDGNEHSVYSQYNMAATFFNPLNLDAGKDFNFQTMPGYEAAENLFNKLANKVKDQIGVFFKDFNNSALKKKVCNLEIKNIEIADLTEDQLGLFKVSIDTTIWITGLKYHLDLNETLNVPVKFTTDVSVPVNINQDVTIDLSNVTVSTPTIAITTDLQNQNGEATLVVPVKDDGDNVIGNAEVDLSQVTVTADATVGEIKLDGTTVAHLTYNDDVTATITVDETVATTVNIDKWIYFGEYELDADGNIVPDGTNTDAKQFHIWVTRDLSDAAESLWGTAQSALGNVNDMLDDLRDIVTEVNNLVTQINTYQDKINASIDDVVDNYLMKYLDKINNTVVGLVNSFNRRLQPFMVASTNKGFKRLSEVKAYPTVLSSDVTVYPTTKTMEIFCPLARKHVAVTNVFKNGTSYDAYNNGDCESKMKAVNQGNDQVNKILDGTVRVLNVNGMVKGYVYEIAYSVLDFDGNMSTHRYYVEIQ